MSVCSACITRTEGNAPCIHIAVNIPSRKLLKKSVRALPLLFAIAEPLIIALAFLGTIFKSVKFREKFFGDQQDDTMFSKYNDTSEVWDALQMEIMSRYNPSC
jgi:hypothetical protein